MVDKQHIKGTAKKAEGAIKEAAGKVVGSTKLQAEGKAAKAEGAARSAAGDVKDAGRKVGKAMKS